MAGSFGDAMAIDSKDGGGMQKEKPSFEAIPNWGIQTGMNPK
jgi:hypothetical protein